MSVPSSTPVTVSGPGDPIAHLDDLEVGTTRMARAGGRRVCLVRTDDGVFAVDQACPHEGYGMTQGDLEGDVLTCAWHNWKFRVTDGVCLLGEEGIRTYPVTVDQAGGVHVEVVEPDPAERRPLLLASLRSAIQRDQIGQASRDVVRLLQVSADPGELVWQAVAHGAPRAEFGWGHAIASATDCLAMVELYDGDHRAIPIVQAIAGISESERDRPPRPLPEPARELPADGATAFRVLVESEQISAAQALVLAAIEAGQGPDDLAPWFTSAVSDHHLSYGHGAIYVQKAFQLLERLGWERAATVLPHLVPSIVYGTREDRLPYMRPFMRALAEVDLAALADQTAEVGWVDDDTLRTALLGADRTAPLHAAVAALQAGAGVHGVLDVVVAAVSERLLRYDIRGEQVFEDDFGWLDITHGLTYANATRWHHDRAPGPDTVRLALFCAFLAHWTGRHEWHAGVPEVPPRGDAGDLALACVRHEPEVAAASVLATPLDEAAVTLQRASLLDGTTAPIVHAHAVKMSRAAAEESARVASPRPLAAAARFIAAPKLERFVAANVVRSIELLRGRTPRRHCDAIGAGRGPQERSERPVSCGPVLSGAVGGSFGEQRFVGDRCQHLAAGVPAPVVVGVDEAGDLPPGLVLGGEVLPGEQLVLEGGVEALRRGVVQRRADSAHRLGHPERVAGSGEQVADVLAALVAVEHDAVDVAAAHRGGHAQRGLGDRRVVVLAHGEAWQPPGREVEHGGQVELALAGGDLGQVPAPALIDPLGAEVPLHQVRDRRSGFVRTGETAALALGRPAARPWRAIEAATVFFDTFQPAAARSSHTRGNP